MIEIITSYPVIFGVVIAVIFFLIKNHIVATTNDVSKLKEDIIKDLLKNKVFITPEQLSSCENLIRRDVKQDFLSLAVFNEFKTGIDRQFKTVFTRFDEGKEQFRELNAGINEIRSFLIGRGGKK